MDMIRDHGRVPARTRKALENYGKHGLRPGGCTEAILCNEFFNACMRADDDVALAIPAIVSWIAEYLPADSYGSREIYEAWIDARATERKAAFDAEREGARR